MRLTKIISAVLCTAMVFSLTGCFGKSKISPDKVASYAEDNEAEVYDKAKKYVSFLEDIKKDGNHSDLKNGVVITLEGKDIKTVFSNSAICILPIIKNFYDKDMTQAVVYCKGNVKDNDGHVEYIYSAVFEDEDAAEDYFESLHKGIQPNASVKTAKNDDGEEDGIEYSVMTVVDGSESAGVGAYRDGKTVMLIVAYGHNDTKGLSVVDGYCEDFGLHLISDV